MNKRKQELKVFFDSYKDTFNKGIEDKLDGKQLQSLYSECFIGANPAGVTCGKNDEKLLKVFKDGYSFYKKIGITSMEIVSSEINILDNFHSMIKINWRSHYTKEDSNGTVEFENIYFVQTVENESKIFGWITPDEQKVLKEKGLV